MSKKKKNYMKYLWSIAWYRVTKKKCHSHPQTFMGLLYFTSVHYICRIIQTCMKIVFVGLLCECGSIYCAKQT